MFRMYALIPLLFVALASGAPQDDLIVDLPGLSYTPNFKQYSGYLDGASGKHLHYWFTESQNDPSKDPLVLWLTGGPGCSSLSALLTENGPFRSSLDGSTLSENPTSWNKVANVIFMESPTCVGFSYNDNFGCRTGDEEVAEMNYAAIKNFFQKFPEYNNREFFISGESYGGIYVPTLSVKIVEGNKDFPINFQGYTIGNGMLNYAMNDNSLIYFGYYHGLISDNMWFNMVESCCNANENPKSCDFSSPSNFRCQSQVIKARSIIYGSGLNIYNLYADCSHFDGRQQGLSRYTVDLRNLFSQYRKTEPTPYSSTPCIDSRSETNYLNRQDVRQALHIPSSVQDWEICSDAVTGSYQRTVTDVSSQLEYLHKNNIRALIYNGDVDMACNFLGNEWLLDSLNIELVEDSKPWNMNGQVAGFWKQYDSLDFVTVKGSGHMVPADKPEQCLKLFTSFIRNEPY